MRLVELLSQMNRVGDAHSEVWCVAIIKFRHSEAGKNVPRIIYMRLVETLCH